MSTTIREDVHEATWQHIEQACINGHLPNIHTLYVKPSGKLYWSEQPSTNTWDTYDGDFNHPTAMLYQGGTGSISCDCDACLEGVDPWEWVGDDVDERMEVGERLVSNLEGISVGYFDDEDEADDDEDELQ
jgi:hypothetical protein